MGLHTFNAEKHYRYMIGLYHVLHTCTWQLLTGYIGDVVTKMPQLNQWISWYLDAMTESMDP